MRYLIFLMLLAPKAHAIAYSPGPQPTTAVINQMSSTMTVAGVTISTTSPTSVVVSTNAAYRFVTVQNLCVGGNADLYCGENSVVLSTQTGAAGLGYEISRGSAAVTFTLLPGQDFFCLASARTSGCQAATIRGR